MTARTPAQDGPPAPDPERASAGPAGSTAAPSAPDARSRPDQGTDARSGPTGAQGADAPGAPQPSEPGGEETATPGDTEAKAPDGGPETAASGSPAVASPGSPETATPGDAEAKAPDGGPETAAPGAVSTEAAAPGEAAEGVPAAGRTRRPPAMTTDTARPEGGGRAAPGDAPAPARQWPLLTVLGLAALGLLVVGTDLFPQSFRVGTVLVGVALLTGAALRRALPSVGMLAVRSRFTDMVTYGLMGTLIVLLALMAQPGPWLRIPFLEDVLHLTIT
ncbi:DUF3017 domain-containing protein [Streptomyces sp. NPDC053755]|uniref:DUF3017 domain-containing protein n=1 Tax=Streptomyces sp. NPDC053755 TaxID=3155815 RepID=UPI00344295CE